MKTLKYTLGLVLVFLVGCTMDERDLDFVDNISTPENVSAVFNVTQDNTGLVAITPNASGAASYVISYGDGSGEQISIMEGGNATRTYPEGTYEVAVEAIGYNGLKTLVTQTLRVYFRAPENLQVKAEIDAINPFAVNVSASADFAASYEVYFDTSNPDEVPTPMQLDEIVQFEYPSVGEYTIRVVALSGGTETTVLETTVSVNVPVNLPLDFEIFDASKLFGFGGASATVVANPDTNGNPSATVVEIIKGGPEVWAGNVVILSSPIDFSGIKIITADVWSPRPGAKLLLKLENLTDGNIFIEKEAILTGNSSWETVTFDFSDIDMSKTYQKVVWFYDFGTVGAGGVDWTFYIDNIKQGVFVLEDLEVSPPTFITFGDIADIDVVANPDPTGFNTSSTVGQFTKTNGSQTWAGALFELTTPLDLASYSKISLKTWSPKVGAVVKLKLENQDGSITHEVDLNTTVGSTWEELVYDFSAAPAASYVKVIVFFDFGNAGDGAVYYFDDFILTN